MLHACLDANRIRKFQVIIKFESIYHDTDMFRDALASFLSVTTRGIKLKISEVIVSGTLLGDVIIIGFPYSFFENLIYFETSSCLLMN